MATWLDIECLYLLSDGAARGLQLLPLVFIGSSPPSAKNACYFFNRVEKEGVRFVPYHFADRAELTERFAEATAAIRSLARTSSPAGT
jgi:hypothetical protein